MRYRKITFRIEWYSSAAILRCSVPLKLRRIQASEGRVQHHEIYYLLFSIDYWCAEHTYI